MRDSRFIQNISKNKKRENMLASVAQGIGISTNIIEQSEKKHQKDVIKKLNAENKKIFATLNNQLIDLMKERIQINKYIGQSETDDQISSMEELTLIAKKASADLTLSSSNINKKKVKFSTVSPTKKRRDFFFSKIKSKVSNSKLIPLPISAIKTTDKNKNSDTNKAEENTIESTGQNNTNNNENYDKKLNKKSKCSLLSKKNDKLASYIKQKATNDRNKEGDVSDKSSSSLIKQSTLLQKKSLLLSRNLQTKKTKGLTLLDNDNDNTNKGKADDIDEHEDYRKLEQRPLVDDSLSYSEGNNDIYLGMDSSIFAIDPDCLFKIIWDYLIYAILGYYILLAPFILAYFCHTPFVFTLFTYFWDIVFIIDVFLSFFVSYYTFEEELISNLKLIAQEYNNSVGFIVDLVAAIPFGFIVGLLANKAEVSYLDLLIFLKLVKIFKLLQEFNIRRNFFSTITSNIKMNMSNASQRLIEFLIYFIIASHFISCLWIYFGNLNPSNNWIIKAGMIDDVFINKYLISLYFHWTTIFTIGYGDILSTNAIERIYNCFLLFIGIAIYSYTISSLGSMLTNTDNLTTKYDDNVFYLDELRKKYNISDDFYMKLVMHLRYNMHFNKIKKYSFVNELPNRVKTQLLADMHRDIIRNCSFFKDSSINYATKVVQYLKPIRTMKKERLITEGEFLLEVFFIKRGVISIMLTEVYLDKKLIDLRKNEYFGDILVETNERCPFNIKVSSKIADLFTLKKEDYNEIKEEFPEQLTESLIISYYNYQSLLDLAQMKKKKISEEINKWKNEDDLSMISDIDNNQSQLPHQKSDKGNKAKSIRSYHNNSSAKMNKEETNSIHKNDSSLHLNHQTINFNVIIQNNNYITQSANDSQIFPPTNLNSNRRRSIKSNSIDKHSLKNTNYIFKDFIQETSAPLLTIPFESKQRRRMSCVFSFNKPKIIKDEVIHIVKQRDKLIEIDKNKFIKSELFINKMVQNQNNVKQLETNPQEFFMGEMKNMLTECAQNDQIQNERLINVFNSLCSKYGIENNQ